MSDRLSEIYRGAKQASARLGSTRGGISNQLSPNVISRPCDRFLVKDQHPSATLSLARMARSRNHVGETCNIAQTLCITKMMGLGPTC